MEPISTDVTPSFDPAVVDHFIGTDESYTGGLRATFALTYDTLQKIHDARRAAEANPEWTKAARVLKVADMASKVQDRVTRAIDANASRLTVAIANLEKELSQPMEVAAGLGNVPGEIRAHVKAMDPGARNQFLNSAIAARDTKTLDSVLGAPAYLSGLTDEDSRLWTQTYWEAVKPEKAAGLKTARTAQALLERTSPLLFREIEKAVGASFHTVNKLRNASNAAMQALVLRDIP